MTLLIATTFVGRGAKTLTVETAIKHGHRTLQEITAATGFAYRDVNAYVTSLQSRKRIWVENPDDVRGAQRFFSVEAAVDTNAEPVRQAESCYPDWLARTTTLEQVIARRPPVWRSNINKL